MSLNLMGQQGAFAGRPVGVASRSVLSRHRKVRCQAGAPYKVLAALGGPPHAAHTLARAAGLPTRTTLGPALAPRRRRAVSLLCRADGGQSEGASAAPTAMVRGEEKEEGNEGAEGKQIEGSKGNGAAPAGVKTENGSEAFPTALLEAAELPYSAPTDKDMFWTRFKLAFALPWRRFKKDSVLTFTLEGEISDQSRGFFDSGLSLPAVCSCLRKAALDPRVQGVAIEIGPLGIGWAKVQEIKRHIDYFRASGKYVVAWMKQGAEKEYYLATACSEIYAPPTAYLSLRGFVTGGTFLRGVLDKVGVEPQVRRIGSYKSAGDQLLRQDMSPEQQEQLTDLQDDVIDEFLLQVSTARGKTTKEVKEFIHEGVYDMQKFKSGGWITDLWYEDELLTELKMRTTGLRPRDGESEKEKEKREKALAAPLRRVGLRKYSAVSPTAFGLAGGKKRIAVLRTAGAIVGKSSGAAITPDGVIPKLRALAKDKSVAAVVLRIDSPGGDALSADLMWREIRQLDAVKPVIASMADVAASGGYYMAMAARAIVAEPLTITGSIGVVTGKFNLSELYCKIGYNKVLLSWGRYALLLSDIKGFNEEEEKLFDASAQHAYESFRNKAALSRGMEPEVMEEVAQGRVWSGLAAKEVELVDAVGGIHKAISLARHAAGIPEGERVTVMELGRVKPSPAALLGGGALLGAVLMGLLRGQSPAQAVAAATGAAAVGLSPFNAVASVASTGSALPALGSVAQQAATLASVLQPGRCAYLLTEVDPLTVGCSSSTAVAAGLSGGDAVLSGSTPEDTFLSEGL
ncbi:signal peptide peptidase [Volvox carteri f. nagariensis]|uniref:Signal peptide peptidase n=1 Tax=Volvox carteri f. nagariensis TaxID=3068 RepID=D8U236_VOLCA|nr:signal peptide peptidase [Volvox carteri f. nagariensis]EFJ46294.1 signal peptide peptidase [Volvox carteri f. nagariensis]|eukprot:XP_002952741.1 signal peptide peptidase [Volvox carteri f. nagariensis]